MTREAERKRLVELIDSKHLQYAEYCTEMAMAGNYGVPSLGEWLADHLLDNGIVVPPVNVGQEVWVIVDGFRNPMQGYISRFSLYQDCEEIVVRVIGYLSQSYQNKDFGKTVFLTREEAEKALRKEDEVK